jgi:predicted RNase H-like HicB family nuclease
MQHIDPRDYEIRIWYSSVPGDDCFIAQVVEWPDLKAHGASREEAAREIQVAIELAIELAQEDGTPIPEPSRMVHA